MSEAKHTPGPWKLDATGKDVWSQDGGHCIASCGPTRDFSYGMTTSTANARLIAAAPALLAACEAALVSHVTAYDIEVGGDCNCVTCNQLRAAIAEAKG